MSSLKKYSFVSIELLEFTMNTLENSKHIIKHPLKVEILPKQEK